MGEVGDFDVQIGGDGKMSALQVAVEIALFNQVLHTGRDVADHPLELDLRELTPMHLKIIMTFLLQAALLLNFGNIGLIKIEF